MTGELERFGVGGYAAYIEGEPRYCCECLSFEPLGTEGSGLCTWAVDAYCAKHGLLRMDNASVDAGFVQDGGLALADDSLCGGRRFEEYRSARR